MKILKNNFIKYYRQQWPKESKIMMNFKALKA